MKIVVGLIFMLNLIGSLNATEISGVHFEDLMTSENGESLVLNGAGVRKKFFTPIYVAALYLSKHTSEPSAVINLEGSKRMTMHILYSEIKREKFIAGWNEGFQANHSDMEMNTLRSRLERFNSFFQTLHKGDEVILDFLPGVGTQVTIRNEMRGPIQGQDFFQGLLKVWLGDDPVTKSLKDDLLGI